MQAALFPWVCASAWAALQTGFWLLRLGVYAVLVGAAWIRIIEEDRKRQAPSKPSQPSKGLSSAALTAHDARQPPPSPAPSTASSDSIEDWSIWGSEESALIDESAEPSGNASPSIPPAAAAAPSAPLTPAVPSARPRPGPVSASAEPTPPAQQSSVADAVLPDTLAELAADREEKEALAGAALMAGSGAPGVPLPPSAVAATKDRAGKRSRHHKKPWLNRKIEAMFRPYGEKTNAAGYMIYKGFGRMGSRVERGTGTLGKHLEGAIRDTGAEAVRELEGLVKKWVKFAGVVALLTVALLPLPSVRITLSMGA